MPICRGVFAHNSSGRGTGYFFFWTAPNWRRESYRLYYTFPFFHREHYMAYKILYFSHQGNRFFFLGVIISDSGVQPDPSKDIAIRRMATPQNKKRTAEIYGHVKLHIRNLLPKVLNWPQQQDNGINMLKDLLCRAPLLRPSQISTDASEDGICAVLLQ